MTDLRLFHYPGTGWIITKNIKTGKVLVISVKRSLNGDNSMDYGLEISKLKWLPFGTRELLVPDLWKNVHNYDLQNIGEIWASIHRKHEFVGSLQAGLESLISKVIGHFQELAVAIRMSNDCENFAMRMNESFKGTPYAEDDEEKLTTNLPKHNTLLCKQCSPPRGAPQN